MPTYIYLDEINNNQPIAKFDGYRNTFRSRKGDRLILDGSTKAYEVLQDYLYYTKDDTYRLVIVKEVGEIILESKPE